MIRGASSSEASTAPSMTTTERPLRNGGSSGIGGRLITRSDVVTESGAVRDHCAQARTTSGYGALPGGPAAYRAAMRSETTTTTPPEEIYQTGLREVQRIQAALEAVKKQTGFQGDLPAFFAYIKTEPKFRPYKTQQEVLDGFEAVHRRMMPQLARLFGRVPKTPFEVRPVEAYREKSAAGASRGRPPYAEPDAVRMTSAGHSTTAHISSAKLAPF